MKSLLTFALLCTLACLAASQSSDAPPAGVTATQSLRTTWTTGSDTYYLYDITLTNGGSSSLSACGLLYLINFDSDASGSSANTDSGISLSQTWNVIVYATAGGPPHQEFGPKPPISVAPGQTDTSGGYVVKNSETTLTLLYDSQACGSSTSSSSSSSSSDSASASASSSSSDSSPSSCTLSMSQALSNSWNTGSQWSVTITNRGSSAVTALDLLAADVSRITQIWGVSSTASGHYSFPSYTTSIAPGATFSFGYISSSSALVSFSIESCPASGSQDSSSAASSAESASGSSSVSESGSGSSASGCSATSTTTGSFESLNKWSDGTYNYIQYPLSVQNTGSESVTSATAFIYFTSSYGTISDSYNLHVDSTEASGATVTISTFNLAPGQTFNGAGFTFKYAIANENDLQYSHSHYTLPYSVREVSTQC